MPHGLLGELLSRCGRCRRSRPCRRRIATRQEIDGDAGGESEKEKDDEGHGCWRFVYPTAPVGKRGNGSRRCPSGISPAEHAVRADRSRDRGSPRRLVGAAARAHARRARQSGSPLRSARVIPFASSSQPSSAATRSCSALTIAVGFLLTRVILKIDGVAAWDERVSRAIVRERTGTTVDLSWIGSTLAGGLVIPALVGILLVVFLVSKHWRLAAFTLFVICVESGTYRATSLVVHRDRPDVERLESLPVDASYPSGHTAASVALFGGLLIVLASRIQNLARSGSSSGRSSSRSRCSWPGRACCAACTTSPMSPSAS